MATAERRARVVWEGDQELVDFFSAALENNLEASQRAKELLTARLERERE